MKRMAWFLTVAIIAGLTPVPSRAGEPTGVVSCTSKVPPSTCSAASGGLQLLQAFPLMRAVDFVVADPEAFIRVKEGTADIVFAKAAKLQGYIPIRHSSFDDGILFEVSKNGSVRCPDRVVISTDLFRPLMKINAEKQASKAHPDSGRAAFEYSESFDANLAGEYQMFIQGYIEGCWNAKQAGE